MSQQTPPALDSPDPLRRLGAALQHAVRLRRVPTMSVDQVIVSFAGREWDVVTQTDDDPNAPRGQTVEWWTDRDSGVRILGDQLTQADGGGQ